MDDRRRTQLWLLGAVLVGLIARAPGVMWGANFPTGWAGHHVDELTHQVNAEILINPLQPPRWPPHPYPKGLAAHVAAPLLVAQAARGRLLDGLPSAREIVTTGRVVSLAYGVATILLVFMFVQRLGRPIAATGERRPESHTVTQVALFAAWIVALGGLHVSQSHFFTADVPAVFWILLGSYALYIDVEEGGSRDNRVLAGAAFAFGVAFGVKLVLATLPSLGIAVLLGRPRVFRVILAAAFFITGVIVVNLDFFNAVDFIKSVAGTGGATYDFSYLFSLLVYAIQLPSLISIPILLLAIPGTILLAGRTASVTGSRRMALGLAVILPQVVTVFLVLFTVNNFLRHLIPFIPWLAVAAGYSMSRLIDLLRRRQLRSGLVIAPVFVYLGFFVVDGERLYINEPRNDAARWVLANVASGTPLWWQGHRLPHYPNAEYPYHRPPVIVMEMHRANEVLSGMGWKYNMPADYRRTFGKRPQSEVEALQAIFKGTTEYREVARFSEDYWMPEFNLVERLLGNRSRNYVTEIVIFRSQASADRGAAPPSVAHNDSDHRRRSVDRRSVAESVDAQ